MASTSIEWTDDVWNPVRGCTRVSPGCGGPNHEGGCYAEKIAARFSGPGQPFHGFAERTKHGGRWAGKVALVPEKLTEPMSWRKPRRIFVNSMSDLFHEDMRDEWIDQVFAVMALCPQHTFQVLTKRAKRMRDYVGTRTGDWMVVLPDAIPPGLLPITKNDVERRLGRCLKFSYDQPTPTWPLPNVWLGVSVEDQRRADERIPNLLATPAAVRFLSCEPLLGPVDVASAMTTDAALSVLFENHAGAGGVDPRGSLHWVICGGESGPGARPMHPDWARGLRDQCVAAGVSFFLKQWGEWAPADDQHGQAAFSAVHATTGMSRTNVSVGMTFIEDGGPYAGMRRVGKKAAGATLDGCEWRQMPPRQPVEG